MKKPTLVENRLTARRQADPLIWTSTPVRIERTIIGTPSNGKRFLRGMRLLPPRAGMIATLLKDVFPTGTK